MKRMIILTMFCLLLLNHVDAINTTYVIEPIMMIGDNHFEQDPGKRHAPPRHIVLSVEQEDNVFTIHTYSAQSIKIILTNSANEYLFETQGTPTNGELKFIVPCDLAEATANIILKINNKTYIGHKQ